jgi:hypothetical protein
VHAEIGEYVVLRDRALGRESVTGRPRPAGRNVFCYHPDCRGKYPGGLVWYTNESDMASRAIARRKAREHAAEHNA